MLKFFVLLFFVLSVLGLSAQEDVNKVKVAFLFKFTSFISIPQKSGAFVIGVLEQEDIFAAMNDLYKGKTFFDRPVQVNRIKSLAEVAGCDLVYLGSKSSNGLDKALVMSKKIIVVTESENPMPQSAVINFILEDNKVRFELNNTFAQELEIKINSRLLQLARKVE